MQKKLNASLILVFLFIIFSPSVFAQEAINFNKVIQGNQLHPFNRTFVISGQPKKIITMNEQEGEGLVWLSDFIFTKGTIEIDLQGKDEFQKSFVGIAFYGVNDSTYDAVYFRPFNFQAKDSVRRIHAVQYISHPEYPWKKLREEKNGQYEKAIFPPPNPNEWFHAKINISEEYVSVFVNNSPEPALKVKKLHNRKSGKLALWTGDSSGGSFSNLRVFNK